MLKTWKSGFPAKFVAHFLSSLPERLWGRRAELKAVHKGPASLRPRCDGVVAPRYSLPVYQSTHQSSNPFRPGKFRSTSFSSSWWTPFQCPLFHSLDMSIQLEFKFKFTIGTLIYTLIFLIYFSSFSSTNFDVVRTIR